MRVFFACVSLLAATASAELKEVDTFLELREPPAREFSLRDGRVSGQEARLGVPTFVWLDRRADAPDLRAAGVTPEEAARRALLTHASLYGSTPAQLAEVKLSKLLDLGRGAIVATFERRFDGRRVFHERISVVLSQRLEPVALSGYFAPQKPSTHEWRLAADTALAVAFEGIAGAPVAPQHFVANGFDSAGAQRFTASTLPGHTITLARTQALWFTGAKGLVPAWYVELDGNAHEAEAELVGTVVSAIDGTVLWRRSLTQHDSYNYRVWADPTTKRPHDGPYGANSTPHPTGTNDGTTLTYTAPSLISIEHAGLSTGDPWLPSGATTLTGNNVEAYADLVAPQDFSAGDFRAQVTSPNTFDATYDLNAAPGTATQRAAGLAQVFYVVNWLHDWFYDHGFDEAAGNAQTNNFGRGGAAGDAIMAQGQDYSGTSNANMSTPADGARPRMQMYLWSPQGVPVTRDGTLDSSIVAHEWGHYLSQRLADMSGTQGAGMGEGWGDFVGLLMTTELSDAQKAGNAQFEGAYVGALFSLASPVDAPNALYFGSRRAPYSTSFAKNALTFRHIANGATLPTTHPLAATYPANSEVHNTGEIWAVMLWDSYVALLNAQPRLSFSQAQSRMLDYTVAGLSAMPGSATFTEARDAMLAVAAASDVEDYRLMLRAFARRGLGLRAVSPPRESDTNAPLSEDFSANDLTLVTATLVDDGVLRCDRDGVLDSGEDGTLRLTIRNPGADVLNGATATVTTSLPGTTVGAFTFAAVPPLQSGTATATVRLPALTQTTGLTLTVTLTAPGLPAPGTITSEKTFTVNHDDLPASSASDDAEGLPSAWTFASAATPATTFAWSRLGHTGTEHRYFGPDPSVETDISLVSPPLVVGSTAFGFTFKNRFDFELDGSDAYDGAVIELSTNDGATWIDIGAQTSPGYNFTLINDAMAVNPLKGRAAFSGRSAAYPAWVTTTVSLGTTYAGQTVRVRLRIGTDDGVSANGWDVDDFVFTGITNTPFPARVADRKSCVNSAPVANAGADLAVDEGALVTLSHAASTDADMNMLTATWTQVSGAMVTLNGNQFTAPMVTANEVLVFALRVNDGTVDSANTDEVSVTVRNVTVPPVNTPPTVSAGTSMAVEERATFTLTATASDADGDALTYEWRQVSGPAATLGALNTPSLQGTAPEVTANTPMVFEVKVNDGTVDVTSQVTVNVRDEAAPANRAPTVMVTAPTLVDVDQSVTVVATASDPDGDAVTITWRQVSGPTVTLTPVNATSIEFRAPASQVVLEATASDGTLSATAQVTIAVRSVTTPTAPRAVVTPEVTVQSGGSVQLSAAGSTGTGTLQYEWEGSRLTFDSTTTEVVTVTAPEVTAREDLSVELRVRDSSGQVASASARVIVEPKAASGCGCVAGSGFEPLFGLVALALLRRRRRAQG